MTLSRFVNDSASLNDKKLGPIYGYQSQLLVPLEKALEPIQPQIIALLEYIEVAKGHCHFPNEHGLTKDEAASVYLYTMDWGEESFYRVFNKALRSEDRRALRPWFSFLKLFDTAVKKLPSLKQNVWRGIDYAVGNECKKGEELVWWAVSSCSLEVEVIKPFISANSTLFLIEASNARDFAGYSNYPGEHEVILPPGIHLRIVSNSMAHDGGLHVVHLREITGEEPVPTAAISLAPPSFSSVSDNSHVISSNQPAHIAKAVKDETFEKTYGESIRLFDKGRACQNGTWRATDNGCALGAGVYSKGVHRFRIKLEYGWAFMGIISESIKPRDPWLCIESSRYYNTPSAHGWDTDGYITINGQVIEKQWTTVNRNDVFDFTLDCDGRRLNVLNERTGNQREISVDFDAAPLPWRLFVILPQSLIWSSRVCLL